MMPNRLQRPIPCWNCIPLNPIPTKNDHDDGIDTDDDDDDSDQHEKQLAVIKQAIF